MDYSFFLSNLNERVSNVYHLSELVAYDAPEAAQPHLQVLNQRLPATFTQLLFQQFLFA